MSKKTEFVIKSQEEVLKDLVAVAKAAGSYSKAVQNAAVQCIAHAIKHGDVTLATKMLPYVRKHDKHILVAFFEMNGPFSYQKADDTFLKNRNWTGVFKGEDTPHWENAKKVTPPKSIFDVREALDRFIKTATAQANKAQKTMNRELIERVEDLLLEHAIEQYQERKAQADAMAEDKTPVEVPALKAA
jgi:hypothetical protein